MHVWLRAVSREVQVGGASRDRTGDLLLAKQALSQLSYGPIKKLVGLGRVELPTSPLSGVRSNQLSYRPGFIVDTSTGASPRGNRKTGNLSGNSRQHRS